MLDDPSAGRIASSSRLTGTRDRSLSTRIALALARRSCRGWGLDESTQENSVQKALNGARPGVV